MPGAGRLKLERADNSRQVVEVALSPASHVVSNGVPPKDSMWIRDHHERDVRLLELSVVFQPNLHDDVNESKLIMQLIPYPALVNQPDSASDDQTREPQADHHRHPGVSMTVVPHLRLEDRPVLDELIHSCEQNNG